MRTINQHSPPTIFVYIWSFVYSIWLNGERLKWLSKKKRFCQRHSHCFSLLIYVQVKCTWNESIPQNSLEASTTVNISKLNHLEWVIIIRATDNRMCIWQSWEHNWFFVNEWIFAVNMVLALVNALSLITFPNESCARFLCVYRVYSSIIKLSDLLII